MKKSLEQQEQELKMLEARCKEKRAKLKRATEAEAAKRRAEEYKTLEAAAREYKLEPGNYLKLAKQAIEAVRHLAKENNKTIAEEIKWMNEYKRSGS